MYIEQINVYINSCKKKITIKRTKIEFEVTRSQAKNIKKYLVKRVILF